MKKQTKELIVAASMVSVGNIITNIITIKRDGWQYNKETHGFEREFTGFCSSITASLAKGETEEKIQRNNIIWSCIGLTTGLVIRYINR